MSSTILRISITMVLPAPTVTATPDAISMFGVTLTIIDVFTPIVFRSV